VAKSFEEEIAELTAAMNDAAARGVPFQYQGQGQDPEAWFGGWEPGKPFPASSGSLILDIVTDAAEKRLTLALMTSLGLLHARPLAAVDELGWFPAVLPEGAVLVLNCGQLQGIVVPPAIPE
jgi:hypothetical protein